MRKHLTQYRVALNQRSNRVELEKRLHPLIGVVLVFALMCGITGMLVVALAAIVSDESLVNVIPRVLVATSSALLLLSVLHEVRREDSYHWRPVSEVDAQWAAAAVHAVAGGKNKGTRRVVADEAAAAIAHVRKYAQPA